MNVFVTGGTGYMGRRLVQAAGAGACRTGAGAAGLGKEATGWCGAGCRRCPHLGVQLPLPSGLAAVEAAQRSGARHLVYVSVAHPAPMMKAYIEVRSEVEQTIHDAGLNATILRPWYVLGPGHRWPYLLLPFYKICEWLPATRAGAQRLGLVTLEQMILALVAAVENPARGVRVVTVPEIRAAVPDTTEAQPSKATA